MDFFKKQEIPKSPENENQRKLKLLEQYGAKIERDKIFGGEAYIIQFASSDAKTTIRVLFNDYTGDDLVITNMTTWPQDERGKGFGTKAIQYVLQWAQENGLNNIRATQVLEGSENFWMINGFDKMEGDNISNDFIYKKTYKSK